MIKSIKVLLLIIIPGFMFAQDTLTKKSGWGMKIGIPVFFPTTDNYDYINDNETCHVADGIDAHYTINPVLTLGKNIEVFRYTVLHTRKSSEWLLGYGIGYKQSAGRVNLFGHWSGGISFQSYDGYGSSSFKEHYIQAGSTLYYKHNVKRNNFILTGINISADFLVRTESDWKFKNHPGAPFSFDQHFNSSNRDWNYYYPDACISYELGFGFSLKNKWRFVPIVKTSVVNINRLFEELSNCLNPFNFSPRKIQYSKEVIFGITVIPHYRSKAK